MEKTIVMVQKDLTAQWLAGDELKQDQFKFIYNTCKVIYDSALRDLLLNEEPKVVENVIPNLVAFHAILLIRGILDTKENEKKKEIEKAEREGKKVSFQDNEEEKKQSVEETIMNKRISDKMNHSTTSAFSTDAQKEKELQRIEIERYGVNLASNFLTLLVENVDLGRLFPP